MLPGKYVSASAPANKAVPTEFTPSELLKAMARGVPLTAQEVHLNNVAWDHTVAPALAEQSRQAAAALAAEPLNVLVSAGPRRPGVTHSMRRCGPPRLAPLTAKPLRRTGRSEDKPTILD